MQAREQLSRMTPDERHILYTQDISNYRFDINPRGFDVGEILLYANISNQPYLRILLSNESFKQVLSTEISGTKEKAKKVVDNIITGGTTIGQTQRASVRDIGDLTQKKITKDDYTCFWFSLIVSSKARQLRREINNLEMKINSQDNVNPGYKKKLDIWESELVKYDLFTAEKWECLKDIVGALSDDANIINGINDFVDSLTRREHPDYVQNTFIRYYLVSQLFTEAQQLQSLYERTVRPQARAHIKPIYDLIFATDHDQEGSDQANLNHIALIQATDPIRRLAYVNTAMGHFVQIQGLLLKLTKGGRLETEIPLGYNDGRPQLGLAEPYSLFPEELYEDLVNLGEVRNENDESKVILNLDLSDIHHNVAQSSYIAFTQSLHSLGLIKQARIKIEEAETRGRDQLQNRQRNQQQNQQQNDVEMGNMGNAGAQPFYPQAAVHPLPINVNNVQIAGPAAAPQRDRNGGCIIL